MKTALVFAGGALGNIAPTDVPQHDFVVAADSGLHNAHALGVSVDAVVGDLDSVDRSQLGTIPVVQFPADKDASDLDLAIDHAVAHGATAVVVLGGFGGRVDHWLGVMLGLAQDKWAAIDVSAIMDTARVYVVRDSLELSGNSGEVLSQFAIGGPVSGLTIDGLKWSGRIERLEPGSTLGLSNVFAQPRSRITVENGTLLVIHQLDR